MSELPHRIIWLRRPPRIIESGVDFVPRCHWDEVSDCWRSMRSNNPRLTDGPCWHVESVRRDGHGGATIHVSQARYSMGAVRRENVMSGFVGLGTKAVSHWRGKFLVGCRSVGVATYPGHWEFAPGGSVEPGENPQMGIQRELLEECGAQCVATPRAIALLFDPIAANWEIVHELAIVAPPDSPPNWEYSRLQMVELGSFPEPMSPCTKWMIEIAHRVTPHIVTPSDKSAQ